jgi:hypothetical protein
LANNKIYGVWRDWQEFVQFYKDQEQGCGSAKRHTLQKIWEAHVR